MTVVMMRQMSLENQVEKSEKKNDQDQVDGMRQEVYSKDKEMHNEMSDKCKYPRRLMETRRLLESLRYSLPTCQFSLQSISAVQFKCDGVLANLFIVDLLLKLNYFIWTR